MEIFGLTYRQTDSSSTKKGKSRLTVYSSRIKKTNVHRTEIPNDEAGIKRSVSGTPKCIVYSVAKVRLLQFSADNNSGRQRQSTPLHC